MGQGMIIITPKPEQVTQIAAKYDIGARVIGRITETPGIKILSKGYEATEKLKPRELYFN